MKTLLEGLFAPKRLLSYIRDFIVFQVVNDRITKKGAKYHQFFAVRLAVRKTIATERDRLALDRDKLRDDQTRLAALIDERQVVEIILRHLAVWHDPPPRPPPARPAGVLACRPGRGFRGPCRQSEMS